MAELSKIKFNGAEYDLKDAIAREAIENLPEDKIFPVNVTLTSTTEGTSDKSHTEILAAVNAGKIPFVYIDYSGSKMIASLLFANSNRVSFVYDNQVDEGFGDYAFLQIQNSNVTITWKDKYSTINTIVYTSSSNDTSESWTCSHTYDQIINLINNNEIINVIINMYNSNVVKSSSIMIDPAHPSTIVTSISNGPTNFYISHNSDNYIYRNYYDPSEDIMMQLATVATSGSYKDLSDTPTIPTTTSELVNNSDFITSADAAFFATKDEIPDISNLASKDEIPTTTSELTNDSDFITSSDLPDISNFMIKGTDYVTAGKKANTTLGINATAEGSDTTASEYCSHAEGYNTTASGTRSHAEGYNTTASAQSSHAEGQSSTASGARSHAEGMNTTASGINSHAEGQNTIAQRKSQHVFGEYNIADATGANGSAKGDYIEIVGNGTADDARANARTLDWDGNEVLAGKLTVGVGPTNNMDVATKQYVDTAIGNVNSFNVSVVSTLPATGDTHTIYFVSQASPSTAYDEYMYINNSWELIGNTQIDLSNYLQTTDIADWAKAATKPTYTAAEIGALPDTYTAPVTSVNGQTGIVNLTIPAAQVQSDWNATSGMGVILNKPTIPNIPSEKGNTNKILEVVLDSSGETEWATYIEGYQVNFGDALNQLFPWDNIFDSSVRINLQAGQYELSNAITNIDDEIAEHLGYPVAYGVDQDINFIFDYDGTVDLVDDQGTSIGQQLGLNSFDHIKVEFKVQKTRMSWKDPIQPNWTASSGPAQILNKPPITSSGNNCSIPGKLTVGAAPTANMDVATKQYVDTATTITNTLSSGTLIATINGTNIYAPAYTDADGVSY